jgi:hypothetical protein
MNQKNCALCFYLAPQDFRFFLQVLKVIRLGDLGNLPRLFDFVDLDAQDLDLLF